MIRYQYSTKLKELIQKDNRFILANIDFKNEKYDFNSKWEGYENKTEIRGARIIELPNKKYMVQLEKMGYDIIVFDVRSLKEWFKKGGGKGIFHIKITEEIFPFLLKSGSVVNSAREGGFYSIETKKGQKLHRKQPSKTEKKYLYSLYNNQCYLCKSKEGLSLHHILPRGFAGGTENDNLVLLCKDCHTKINKEKKPGELYYSLFPLRYRNNDVFI